MHDVKLGQLITDDQQRDAIHIAVVPVTASERLSPGEHIDVNGSSEGELIGIVDPFLCKRVRAGQKFFMLLYPGTITSLRHEWTHPAFSEKGRTINPEDSASKKWIREFAEGHGEDYETMMRAARDYIQHNDYFSRGGRFEGERVPDEFWDHYQVITGEVVENQGSFFSCSC